MDRTEWTGDFTDQRLLAINTNVKISEQDKMVGNSF